MNMLWAVEKFVYSLPVGLYRTLGKIYDLLLSLAEGNTEFDKISNLSSSIYALVGIFMLFRIAVSLLIYLIDPDKMSDKQQGGGKLIVRVVVCFLMILSFDFIFTQMIDLQRILVKSDGLIQNLISVSYEDGTTYIKANNDKTIGAGDTSNAGNSFAGSIYFGFLSEESEGSCPQYGETKGSSYITALYAKTNKNLQKCYEDDKLEVNILLAMLIAIVLMVFLIILCIDIIVRTLKFIVYKMIAPIAFISYINPNDKIFNQWLKAFFATYADLFLKLIAVGLLTIFIGIIQEQNYTGFKFILYIFAVLVFAKALPDLISKIFGIDMKSGTFSQAAGLAKKGFGVGAAAVAGGAVGFATGLGAGGGFGTAAWGGLKGMAAGGKNGTKGFGKTASGIVASNQKTRNANAAGSTFMSRTAAKANTMMGMQTKGEKYNEQLEGLSGVISEQDKVMDWASGEAMKKNLPVSNFTYKNSHGQEVGFVGSLNLSEYQAETDRMMNEGYTKRDGTQATSQEVAAMVTERNAVINGAKKAAAVTVLNDKDNVEAVGHVQAYNRAVDKAKASGVEGNYSFEQGKITTDQVKNNKDGAQAEINKVYESPDYVKQTAASDYVKKGN